MRLLHNLLAQKQDYECQGSRVYIRNPRMEDFQQWRDLRQSSRDFLVPWEPTWADDELLLSSFRKRISHYAKLAYEDLAYPFFIFDRDGKTLLGAITISNVRRGVAQMGTLGYWIGASHANQGYMSNAIATVVTFANTELKLNRLEASCLPANQPSLRLLQKSGFTREGFAKSYLKINGRWEDHVLWGMSLSEN